MKTGLLVLSSACLVATVTAVQSDDIRLDGDNYIAIADAAYAARTDFIGLSAQTNSAGEYPVESYWFVKPADAHVVVHVANGSDVLFIELSGKKPVYNFPADYTNAIGAADDFDVYLTTKAGQSTELTPASNAHLVLHVEQLDALHLKLTFDGSLASGAGPLAVVPVKGAISLTKRSGELERLPDAYAGCDNAIYNKMSPHSDLGQFRSATACEAGMHHNVFSAIASALRPAYTYLQAQKWGCRSLEEGNSDYLYRNREHEPFTFDEFGRSSLAGSCQDAAAATTMPIDRIMELSKRLAELMTNAGSGSGDSAKAAKETEDIQKQLSAIGQGINDKQQMVLEIKVNEPSEPEYPVDVAADAVTKVSDAEYVIRRTTDSAVHSNGYDRSGGMYVLVGRWQAPQSGSRVVFSPDLSATARPLSVQSVFIRVGCGDALASEILSRLDAGALTRILQITP